MDVAPLLEVRRILVLGPSGSGKSRFSVQLGPLLGIEVVHLDKHFWHPGWVPTAYPQWREKVQSLAAGEQWIIDGTYHSTLAIRLPRAQAIVYVESSRAACIARVIRRKLLSSRGRPDAPSGEPVDKAFLSYIWNYPRDVEPGVWEQIREHSTTTPLFRVRGPRGANRLLQAVANLRQANRSASSASSHSRLVPRSSDANSS